VALSFYKLFGYPTGVGALIARRDALAELRRAYFSGGTVQFVSVQNFLARSKAGVEGFEDGTPNFLAMPAICDGLDWMLAMRMEHVRNHVAGLTGRLLERLGAMGDHVSVYGPADTRARGGTVTFNLRRRGRVVPYEEVEKGARARNIAIRGGCFCNPGAAEYAFGIPAGSTRACLRGPFSIPRLRACLGDKPVGGVRASIGVATTQADVDSLCGFIADFLA